ncbi:MAG TPA: 50S ribosomal protein L11 methyltransferase [Longimicrobiales bacterium]|nr:50S ribosomal protein L11 methyltransferase [Longimicrobiales bacterium]
MVPERWLVLTVRVPSDEFLDDLTEGLIALGGSAVQEDDDLLTTYVPPPADADAFVKAAADALDARVPGGGLEILWRWEANEDWSRKWREGLNPRRVGEHVIVTPPWGEPEPGPGDVVVVVEPSMAFGTGEHETTRGVLRLLQTVLRPGDRVLDVGAGSGILSIAAVLLGAASTLAVEVDEAAADSGRENLARNGVEHAVTMQCARVDPAFLRAQPEPFDVVLANVLAGVLCPLMPALAAALSGSLILGGILETEADTVLQAASGAGLRLMRDDREGEWWSGLFQHAGA